MSTQDWSIVVLLFIAVALVAYILGSRRAPAPPPSKKPKGTKPGEKATASSDTGPSADKKKKKEPAPLARVDYEEDDEVDPTRVGSGPAPKRQVYQPPVQRVLYDEDAATEEPTHAASLFIVSATAQTDRGQRRKRNEDSLLVDPAVGVFAVADGMGGYQGGERASQIAVQTIEQAFRTGVFEGEPHESLPRRASELARAIQMANAAILETARSSPELEGMGTTVCAARFSSRKNRLYIGHVGDSRCYRLRGGTLKQLTADHTMADHGVKGPAGQHLSRAVGIWPTVPIDVLLGVPKPGDLYLLCSDGLTKMLPDEMIGNVLRENTDPKAAVERLIGLANERGGKDNITVVLVALLNASDVVRPS